MTVTALAARAHPDPTAWVAADPFRAHLMHLCEATGAPWQVVAMRAGISLRQASHLLFGRRGRRLRRLAPRSARAILRLTVDDVALLPRQWMPAGATASDLRLLESWGHPVHTVAREAGVAATTLCAVRSGSARHVTAEFALRVRAVRDLKALDAAGALSWVA